MVRTGPDNDRTRYELLERLVSSSGQGEVYRAALRSEAVEGLPAGTIVSVKQVDTRGLGAHRLEELHAVIARRRHPALGRQIEVFRAPRLPPSVDEGEPDDQVRLRDAEPPGADPADARPEVLQVVAVWVDGQTLAAVAGDAPVLRMLDWCRQVAEALDFLHADLDGDGPLLHRDIKPTNIVVTADDRAVLIDPGLARVGPSLATGSPYGTPGFVPPECEADVTAGSPAADRWQLGATLVAALTGEPPGWLGDRAAIRAALVARCRREVPRASDLADAILAMLEPDPAARPTSAARWVASLHRVATAPVPRRSRRSRSVMAAAGAVTVVLATLAGIAIGLAVAPIDRGGEPRDPAGGAEPGLVGPGNDGETASGGPGFTAPALVDTRVTSGPNIDDERRAYLSTQPLRFCRARDCEVPGGAVSSGMEVTLTCRMNGEEVTNGNPLSATDDDNSILFTSAVWYGVRIDGGPSGLLSEVWIHPDDRAPRGLPLC